ncbi:hypothetical protein R1flu_007472 [Riccia fluitans]|uniref:Uncharacterized protein n=1 Tax=Riccia fluitans TaxID=41844 RepID=A0ABD1YZS4_9MARC
MRMIDLSSTTGSIEICDNSTNLNCELSSTKKIWSALRFLVRPFCCGIISTGERRRDAVVESSMDDGGGLFTSNSLGQKVTGTFYGSRRGKVTFCIQEDPRGPPLLLLEFDMPTYSLLREMSSRQNELGKKVRIDLRCEKSRPSQGVRRDGSRTPDNILLEPVWSLFCNGKEVGFAIKRMRSEGDRNILKLMQSVSMGAGVIPSCRGSNVTVMPDQEIMYMRSQYLRVRARGRAQDSLALHLINPEGSADEKLIISISSGDDQTTETNANRGSGPGERPSIPRSAHGGSLLCSNRRYYCHVLEFPFLVCFRSQGFGDRYEGRVSD